MVGKNKFKFRTFMIMAADASEAVLNLHPQKCVGGMWDSVWDSNNYIPFEFIKR